MQVCFNVDSGSPDVSDYTVRLSLHEYRGPNQGDGHPQIGKTVDLGNLAAGGNGDYFQFGDSYCYDIPEEDGWYVSTAPRPGLGSWAQEKYILNMVASIDNWALYYDGCSSCGHGGGAWELIDLFAYECESGSCEFGTGRATSCASSAFTMLRWPFMDAQCKGLLTSLFVGTTRAKALPCMWAGAVAGRPIVEACCFAFGSMYFSPAPNSSRTTTHCGGQRVERSK